MTRFRGFVQPLLNLLAAALFLFLVPLALSHGGGTPQLVNEPAGPYWLSVWTSPEPPKAEQPLHLTVGLAQPGTGREAGAPVLDAAVTISLARQIDTPATLRVDATRSNSANRLFYEADVTLPEPGSWAVSVSVDGPNGAGSASFEIGIAEAGGTNWLLWGGGGVLVIALIFLLAGRHRN